MTWPIRRLLLAVLVVDALFALLAYRALADSRICWEQPSGPGPVQRVYVSGIRLTSMTISQTSSSPLTYCTQPVPLALPAAIDLELCGGTTCVRGVLPSGRPGPLRLYDGVCRYDANGNGVPDRGEFQSPLAPDRGFVTDYDGRTRGPYPYQYSDHRQRFTLRRPGCPQIPLRDRLGTCQPAVRPASHRNSRRT